MVALPAAGQRAIQGRRTEVRGKSEDGCMQGYSLVLQAGLVRREKRGKSKRGL